MWIPNADQLSALEEFAKLHGRTWKAKLRQAWESGNYKRSEYAPLLQQCRNQGGPFWLNSFSLRAALPTWSERQGDAERTPGTQQWAETQGDNLGESPDY